MSTLTYAVIIKQILQALEKDSIVLPTMPEVAIKIQKLIEDPNVSADQIVVALTSDPFIAAQLIKSANSAVYAGKPRVEKVREAVSRLGYRQMRNLVMSITMSKMFHSKNTLIQKRMQSVWDHSREVASVCYVMARGQRHLSADQAMLAGLLHEIGVLPLCLYLDQNKINVDDELLTQLIIKCSALIGAHLLRKWNFAQEMVTVVAEHEDIHRESSIAPLVDYTDIVTIANLQDRARAKLVVWNNIAAVQRLGWTEAQCQNFLEEHEEEIAKVASMLGMSPQAKSPR